MREQAAMVSIECATVRDGPGGPRSVAAAQPLLDEMFREWPIEVRAGAHGFGLFAQRNLAKGEVVLVDTCALVCHLDPTRCHHCLARTTAKTRVPCLGHLKTGNPCALAFCSTDCHKAAWELYHAPLCGADISRMEATVHRGLSSSSLFTLLAWKLLGVALRSRGHTQKMKHNHFTVSVAGLSFQVKIAAPPEATAEVAVDGSPHTRPYIVARPADLAPMNLLWRRTDAVGTPPFAMGAFMTDIWGGMRDPLKKIDSTAPSDPMLDLQWLLDVYSVLAPNAVTITVPGVKKVLAHGLALMTAGTFFNHSCVPNINRVSDADKTGSAFTFVTTRAIAAGEELSVSYIAGSAPLKDCRGVLMGQYGFECDCLKCMRESPAGNIMPAKGGAAASTVETGFAVV